MVLRTDKDWPHYSIKDYQLQKTFLIRNWVFNSTAAILELMSPESNDTAYLHLNTLSSRIDPPHQDSISNYFSDPPMCTQIQLIPMEICVEEDSVTEIDVRPVFSWQVVLRESQLWHLLSIFRIITPNPQMTFYYVLLRVNRMNSTVVTWSSRLCRIWNFTSNGSKD